MSKPNKHSNLYKTAEVERAGLCPSCGSVLSAVTWTCVLGQFCPGERSSSSGNKINFGNKTSTVDTHAG